MKRNLWVSGNFCLTLTLHEKSEVWLHPWASYVTQMRWDIFDWASTTTKKLKKRQNMVEIHEIPSDNEESYNYML